MSNHPLLRHHPPSDGTWLSWTIQEVLRDLPFLNDHRFQGTPIFPGSSFVELALSMVQMAAGSMPGVVRNIRFEKPLFLAGEDERLLELRLSQADGRFVFEAASRPPRSGEDQRVLHATMTLPTDAATIGEGTAATEASLGTLLARCPDRRTTDGFYAEISAGGNDYGPAFQLTRDIRLGHSGAIARLAPAATSGQPGLAIAPGLLDAGLPLLAVTRRGAGGPFLFSGCEEIRFLRRPTPAGWVHVAESSETGNVLTGDLRILNDAQLTTIEMRGVQLHRFAIKSRPPSPDIGSAHPQPERRIAIAATFTAEPVEEALRFWLGELDISASIVFAPFAQVFQQLLDPASLFAQSRKGLNVILLRLDDWFDPRPAPPTNIRQLRQLSSVETDDLYREIFVERRYLRHGIRLQDGACVVDVGANIGLFTLFVQQECPNARIFAFEPAPPAFEALNQNVAALGDRVRAFRLGLADTVGRRPLTVYRHASAFSGFHADDAADGAALAAVIRNRLDDATLTPEMRDRLAGAFSQGRLDADTIECGVTTLSAMIAELGIKHIDLLKIDAEKAETEILDGIADTDWPKIAQIVVEVHGDHRAKAVQERLARQGFSVAIEKSAALRDTGFSLIYATRTPATEEVPATSGEDNALSRTVDEFLAALSSPQARSEAELLVIVCPPSPAAMRDPRRADALRRAESRLARDLGRTGAASFLGAAEITATCPAKTVHSPLTDRLGGIPYTPDFFAALATTVARHLHRIQRPPFKAIIVDGDETLWAGACGEVGPADVTIDAAKRQVQDFLAARRRQGMLLCLCSRNNERDVFATFAAHPDMPLRLGDFAARRVNYEPKSENVRALAEELGLRLDSFIFLDNDPVERAEVAARCPEVLTLQLPSAPDAVPDYLRRIWAFDSGPATTEDRQRNVARVAEGRRQSLRHNVPSFADFIAGLRLDVSFESPTSEDIPRLSQLSYRTNQFNCTTIRRSEAELRKILASGALEGLMVRVSDRFGTYGRAGAMLFRAREDTIAVDTLMLSCRALGRGIEHLMLARLGHEALNRGLAFVEVPFVPSDRNAPALAFLKRAGNGLQHGHGRRLLFRFPADSAAALRFHPEEVVAEPEVPTPADPATAEAATRTARDHDLYDRIAREFPDAAEVLTRVRGTAMQPHAQQTAADLRGLSLESRIAGIWRDVLRRDTVGLDDNFFEIGGSSLRAVEVVARMSELLKTEVTLVSLFERPTVRTMAAALGPGSASYGRRRQRDSAKRRAAVRRRHKSSRITRAD
jgi:FkbH-like protein/FkbM family methyltransferase